MTEIGTSTLVGVEAEELKIAIQGLELLGNLCEARYAGELIDALTVVRDQWDRLGIDVARDELNSSLCKYEESL